MSTSAGPSNVRRTSSGGFASDDSVGAVRRGRGKGRVEESESDLSEVEGDDSGEYVGGDGSDEESGSEGDEDEGVEGEDGMFNHLVGPTMVLIVSNGPRHCRSSRRP
jgi:hypothetical protein